MANLFFVYTPFQLYVAQEIITQEHLQNNILLKGYVGNNSSFLEVFDYLKVEELWAHEYLLTNLGGWFSVDLRRPLISMKSIKRDYDTILKIIKVHQVKVIYYGDIDNTSARLSSRIFSEQGVKIRFYEEGASHYDLLDVGGVLSHRPLIARFYQLFFDLFLYIPLFGQRLGYTAFVKASSIDELDIDARFSIIPKYHKCFDRQLRCTGVMGAKAVEYIKEECERLILNDKILFLDQPIYEIVQGSQSLYIQTIREYFSTLPQGIAVVVMYHPRETPEIKQMIESVFQDLSLDYIVISKDINLPAEFYLQQIEFKNVVNFYTSSALYNGYLFKEVPFKYLIMEFYEKCLEQIPKYAHNLDGIVKLYKKCVADN